MPSYKSNLKKVIDQLKKDLKEGVDKAINKTVQEAAVDLAASNVYRVHNEGKAVDGSAIGDYKEGPYKKKRKKQDKRTDTINLSMSGKLSKEFQGLKVSENSAVVGWLTPYGGEISKHIENNYDKKIWGATEEDKEKATQRLSSNLIAELKMIK